jgi:hypothetical protein
MGWMRVVFLRECRQTPPPAAFPGVALEFLGSFFWRSGLLQMRFAYEAEQDRAKFSRTGPAR